MKFSVKLFTFKTINFYINNNRFKKFILFEKLGETFLIKYLLSKNIKLKIFSRFYHKIKFILLLILKIFIHIYLEPAILNPLTFIKISKLLCVVITAVTVPSDESST